MRPMSQPSRRRALLNFCGPWLLLLTATLRADDPFAAMVRETEPLDPAEQRKTFSLPPGFDIQLVAAEPDIHKPMNLAFDAAGRLGATTSIEYPWAAPTNRPGRDRLMIFDDFGPDGRARKVTEFADGLNIPIGVYPFRTDEKHWKAVVWSIPHIWLLEDTDGDSKADKRTPLYGPFDHTRDTHGNQASFRRGFDGWIYATHGFNNDSWITNRDGSVVHLNSGNTYRFRLDGSKLEHHTHGQVNPFGLTWDARGNLYSSDCHSAPLYQLLAGGYYPSFGKPHDGLGFAPTMLEHAHGSTAIDGALYYTDDLWPKEYQDTLFIGNVMTSRLNRDKITFIGSTPKATEQPDFLTTTDPWFRPVDNLLGPDGALYVADFYNRIIGHYEVPLSHPGRDRERGRIWRVIYTNAVVGRAASPTRSAGSLPAPSHPALRPAALPSDLKSLIEELASPSLSRRLLAQQEIEDRIGSAAIAELRLTARGSYDFAKPEAKTHAQIHALWALFHLNALDHESMATGFAPAEPMLKVHAMRLLAELGHRRTAGIAGAVAPFNIGNLRGALLLHLGDDDALVKRCAAEALAEWPATSNLPALLEALAETKAKDTHLVYVLRKAIRDTLKVPGAFDELAQVDEARRSLVTDILPAIPNAAAARYILSELPRLGGDAAQIEALLQHAARYGDADSAPAIARFAQEKYPADAGRQLALLNAVRSGLDQRGAPVPPTVASWGQALAIRLLDETAAASAWAALPLDGQNASPVPWLFQERSIAGGPSASLLSSLPPGGEALTGVLRSQPFSVPAELSFVLAGHDGYPDQSAKRVNKVVLKSEDGRVLREALPPRSDIAQRIVWSFNDAERGQRAQLEVIDGDTGDAYAWLAFGQLTPAVVPWPSVAPRDLAERRRDAFQLAAAHPSAEILARLRTLANGPLAPAEQSLVWKTLLGQDAAFADVLVKRLQANSPEAGAIAAVLAEVDQPTARTAVLGALAVAPGRLQATLAMALAGSKGGAEALLQSAEAGKVPAQLVADARVAERLRATLGEVGETRRLTVTKDLPPLDAEKQKLVEARRAGLDPAKADLAKGRQLFQQNCAACHRVGGEGGLIGPQLDGIGNRGAERLCEDILDPNRNVDHAFRQTLLTLVDDDVVSGLFRREEGETLVLADASGQEVKVQKAQLKSRIDSTSSLMPDIFADALPPEAFNDLMAWLLSQRSP